MCVKGDYFKDDDGHRPKITFWPDSSISNGNYGWLFVKTVLFIFIEQYYHCIQSFIPLSSFQSFYMGAYETGRTQ
jgi:hypothetical protein